MTGIAQLSDKSGNGDDTEAAKSPAEDGAASASAAERAASAPAVDTDATATLATSAAPVKVTVTVVDVSIPMLQLTAVNDEIGAAVLQLRIRNIAVQLEMDGVADTMEAAAYLVTDADYFNDKLNVWESLIEPWPLEVRYKTLSAPWIVRDPKTREDLILNRSGDGGRGGGAQSPGAFERKHRRADTAITVRADEMLELNVSSSFCQSLSSVLETVQKLQAGLATNDSASGVGGSGAALPASADVECAALATAKSEQSFNITMHNCTGRAIEFSTARAAYALARNARRRAPYRFLKAFVDTQQPGQAAHLHVPALTNGQDELSASATHNAVTVELGHAVILELQECVDVRSLSVAAGDALRGGGAPKLLDVYCPIAAAEGGHSAAHGLAGAWETEPCATLQYSSWSLHDDTAFRTAQVFDLDLSAPVQRLKIVAREAWGGAGETTVTLRQLSLFTTVGGPASVSLAGSSALSPIDGRSSPLLPLPAISAQDLVARAAKRSSIWQNVNVAELASLPVAASVRAYGATDLPLQQSLQVRVHSFCLLLFPYFFAFVRSFVRSFVRLCLPPSFLSSSLRLFCSVSRSSFISLSSSRSAPSSYASAALSSAAASLPLQSTIVKRPIRRRRTSPRSRGFQPRSTLTPSSTKSSIWVGAPSTCKFFKCTAWSLNRTSKCTRASLGSGVRMGA